MSGVEQNRSRLNFLLDLEKKIQNYWEDQQLFFAEPDPKYEYCPEKANEIELKEKYFCTFPYAYMNGVLHLGHAFTMMKAEFAARFQRLQGKNVLWSFGYHCTGMPIVACANKLKNELSTQYSKKCKNDILSNSTIQTGDIAKSINSGAFVSKPTTQSAKSEMAVTNQSQQDKKTDVFHSKKSKATSKDIKQITQYEILLQSGIEESLIPKFQDPQFWIEYFPERAQKHLRMFGLAIDERRQFITTDRNPYYDAFIRWQFNILYKRGYINFGTRPTIYSPVDKQPCLDHDRYSGENVLPQEYYLIKLKLKSIPECVEKVLKSSIPSKTQFELYMLAATLRPETMYGQTNCFVLPDGDYGVFLAFNEQIKKTSSSIKNVLVEQIENFNDAACACEHENVTTLYICTARCALNLSYQGYIPLKSLHEPHSVMTLKGSELIGCEVKAPLSMYEHVYVLPMFSILMDKGSGIVTSVPSDSPDDYIAVSDIKRKQALQDKYKILPHMIEHLLQPIVKVPSLGDCIPAEKIIEKLQITSQNSSALKEAKEILYKKSFYEGIIIVGKYSGSKIQAVKSRISEDLVNSKEALLYFEPESPVVARSGSECVVAHCEQWYIDYGMPEWKNRVLAHVKNKTLFQIFPGACLSQLEYIIDWLKEWACSRNFGLGSYLPWDKTKTILIESLSDSTIYMAYYTIAHMLQGDIFGSVPGSLNISAEEMTDDVFDYIFLQTDELPKFPKTKIDAAKLQKMRNEFSYWYPMDLRVSGKDLLFNHLTMSLFNHAAIWPNQQRQIWPRAFECNGMVLVNKEKMSKSRGNFLTMLDAINEYGADAARIALADAGDTSDDANFQKSTAVSAIMRLFILYQFIDQYIDKKSAPCRPENSEYIWADYVCQNKMIDLINQARAGYTTLQYRDVVKSAFFGFFLLRDHYRLICGPELMHAKLLYNMIVNHMLVLHPIAPHFTEYVWLHIFKNERSILYSKFPEPEIVFDPLLQQQFEFLMSALEDFRHVLDDKKSKKQSNNKSDSKTSSEVASLSAVIYVKNEYMDWQKEVLNILQKLELNQSKTAPLNKDYMNWIIEQVKVFTDWSSKLKSDALAFSRHKIETELKERGGDCFQSTLPFDQQAVLKKNHDFIQRSLNLLELTIQSSEDAKHDMDTTKKILAAAPLKPSIVFWKVIN